MIMKKFFSAFPSCALVLILFLGMMPSSADGASWVANLKSARQAKKTPTLSNAASNPTLSLLEQDAEGSRVIGGEIRNFRLKPEAKVAAADFFSRYAESLKLGKDDVLKAEPVPPSLKIQGKTHSVVYHQQYYKDVPVLGARYNLIKDADGNVAAGRGKIISGLDVDVTPSILEKDAFEAAKKAVPAKAYAWDKDSKKMPKGLLALRSDSKMSRDKFKLIWRFTISTIEPFGSYLVDIDAKTGEFDHRYNNLKESAESVACTGTSQYDGSVSFTGTNEEGQYRLSCDPTNPSNPAGLSCLVSTEAIDKRRPNPQGVEDPDQDSYFLNSVASTPFADPEDVIGNSVYWAAQKTLEYFDGHFGWIGFDGWGKSPLPLYVDNRWESPKAFYDDEDKSLYFGSNGANNSGPLVSVDIVGHEFMHGVIDHTVDLVSEGEPGALNEGFADIFGTLVKFSIPGKNATWNYAQDTCLSPCAGHRSLSNPKSVNHTFSNLPPHDPDTYHGKFWVDTTGPCNGDNDNCGIHTNATVVGHWFYLLVNGGKGWNDLDQNYNVDPISMDDAAQIAFSTIVYGLMPNATFEEARSASMDVAEMEFGELSQQYRSVQNAWYAVGVGDAFDPDIARSPADYAENVPPWPVTLRWEDHLPVEVVREAEIFYKDEQTGKYKHLTPKKATITSLIPPNTSPLGPDENSGEEDGGSRVRPQEGASLNPSDVSSTPIVCTVEYNLETDFQYYWRTRTSKTPAAPQEPSSSPGVISKVLSFFSWQSSMEPVASDEPEEWEEWGPSYTFRTDKRSPVLRTPKGAATEGSTEGSNSLSGIKAAAMEPTGSTRSTEATLNSKAYPWGGSEFRWFKVDGGENYWMEVNETPEFTAEFEKKPEHESDGVKAGTVSGQLYGQQVTVTVNNRAGWVKADAPDNQDDADGLKYTIAGPLQVNHPYYWGVFSFGPHDIDGDWSNDEKGQYFETSIPQTVLQSPVNGSSISPWDIPLVWEETKGAVSYVLTLSTDLDCVENSNCTTNLYVGPELTGTSAKISLAANGPTKFFWSLTPRGPAPYSELGLASEPLGFNLNPEATKASLIYPSENGTISYKWTDMHYEWTTVTGALQYRLTVYSRNSDGSQGSIVYSNVFNPSADPEHRVHVGETDVDNQYQALPDVGNSDKNGYCWNVVAIGPNNLEGLTSDTWCYTLYPDKPLLLTPTNGATDQDYDSVKFTWTSEWAGNGYTIAVQEGTSNPSSSAFVSVGGATSYSKTLSADKDYTWQVRGVLDDTHYSSSEVWKFSTKEPPCTTPSKPSTITLSPNCESPNPYPSISSCSMCVNTVTAKWPAVSGATSYDLKIKAIRQIDGNETVQTVTVYQPEFDIDTSSSGDDLFKLSVKANNDCGKTSDSSDTTTFYELSYVCD